MRARLASATIVTSLTRGGSRGALLRRCTPAADDPVRRKALQRPHGLTVVPELGVIVVLDDEASARAGLGEEMSTIARSPCPLT
jgi:hypothetical protein